MRFKSTANFMAARFYHWAPPVRTVCFQSWGARLGKSLHSYLLLCKIEFLRKPQKQIQILRSIQPITVLSQLPCSSHEVAWGSPPGRSHTSHESWGIRRTHSDAVCCHMPYDGHVFLEMGTLTYLLLYQASSLSKIRRKFLSSGRLNCSHCISPGSFS